MELFPLNIFPGGGFDSSILTIVLFGLLVMWWLTESFGFVFIGLVVPGYLASVFIISPTSGIVCLVEAIITYGLVWFLSDAFGKAGAWSIYFGRDRFFGFVLTSVFVRLIGELWLWPEAWSAWTELMGTSPHPPGPLNAVGLVLVPLAANMFWKVGVARGLWQMGLPTLIVGLFTIYILVPLTNLRLAEFEVHYEDVAIDILTSPRSLIVLLVTATIAARVNIRYGWDFGGILVPALIAISWFEVDKALYTLGESIVLAFVVKTILGHPVFKRLNIEGPRRIVLVFTVAYILKYFVAWGIHWTYPQLRVIDFFGFGYLLSSLLALKILQKQSAGLVLVPATAVSIVGFVVGGVISSFLLSTEPPTIVDSTTESARLIETRGDLEPLLVRSSGTLNDAHLTGRVDVRDLETFGRLMRQITSTTAAGQVPSRGMREAMGRLGLELKVVNHDDDVAVVLSEQSVAFDRRSGLGMYVFFPGKHGPLVQVPRPQDDPVEILAAYELARSMGASALFLGARSTTPNGRILYPTRSPGSPMSTAIWAANPTFVVRVEEKNERRVWLGRRLDTTFPLGALTEAFVRSPVEWSHPADANGVASNTSLVIVHATRSDFETLAAFDETMPTASTDLLPHWIAGDTRLVAASLAEVDPGGISASESAAAMNGVIEPLLSSAQNPLPRFAGQARLKRVQRVARSLGLGVSQVTQGDDCWWAVRETSRPVRGWGISMIRCDAGAPLAIVAPRPLTEESTWRMAHMLAADLDARVVAFGSLALSDTSDAVDASTWPTLPFISVRAAHRVARRWHSTGIAAIEVRGVAHHRPLDSDLALSIESPMPWQYIDPDLDALNTWLNGQGLDVTLDQGARPLAELRGVTSRTERYVRATSDGRFARIWLSASYRDGLTPSPSPETVARVLARVDVEPVRGDILEIMQKPANPAAGPLDLDLVTESAQVFSATRNPVDLLATLQAIESAGAAQVVFDEARGQVWVVATDDTFVWAIRLQDVRGRATIDLDKNMPTEIAMTVANVLKRSVEAR